MNQPVDESLLPIPRIAVKGKAYTFPFKFVVPEHLLDSACNNHDQSPALRHAHLQLPPSLGTGSNVSHDGKLELDDVAPDMTRIRYVVKARVTRRREVDNKQVLLVEELRKVQVIPAYTELPPMVFEDSRVGEGYIFKKEKDIRKGLFKGKLGRLVVEADNPKPMEVKANTFMSTLASTVVPVFLRFYPTDTKSEPPKLGTLSAKLKFRTHFSTRHISYVPQRKAASFDGLLGQYVETLTLASRQLNGVKWTRTGDCSDADSAYGSMRRGSDATSSDESMNGCSPYYYTQILVPISQPKSKALVPSFQSCYISRTYELDISVSIESGSRITTSPFQLKLPLQVTSVGNPDIPNWDQAEPPSFEEFFTPRSIAPPEGIPVMADMGPAEEGSQLPFHMIGSRPNMPPPPGYGLMAGNPPADNVMSAYAPMMRTTHVGMVAPAMH